MFRLFLNFFFIIFGNSFKLMQKIERIFTKLTD